MIARTFILLTCLIFMIALPAAGEVTVSLPVSDVVRAGRFTCVTLQGTVDPNVKWIELRAACAVPTRVMLDATGVVNVNVPMLVIHASDTTDIQWIDSNGRVGTTTSRFRLATDPERLVGMVAEDVNIASRLFPGFSTRAVVLPASALGNGAWDASLFVDGLLVDESSLSRVDISAALAASVTVGVIGAGRPDDIWPWQREGAVWVLRPPAVGPSGAVEPRGYMPTWGWNPGTPAVLRRQWVLTAVVFSIVALIASLARRRVILATTGVAVVALGAGTAFYTWGSPVVVASGKVVVSTERLSLIDQWTFQTSPRAVVSRFAPLGPLPLPVLGDAEQAIRMDLRLVVDPAGKVVFEARLPADGKIAFVQRWVRPGAAPARVEASSGESPLQMLGRSLYASALTDIKVMSIDSRAVNAGVQIWPDVLIESSKR